ncbi:type IV secretion protein Dot, partial [Legionella pneumophila serogroup 1]
MLKRNVFILLTACSLVATPLFAEDMSSGSQMNNTNSMGMQSSNQQSTQLQDEMKQMQEALKQMQEMHDKLMNAKTT